VSAVLSSNPHRTRFFSSYWLDATMCAVSCRQPSRIFLGALSVYNPLMHELQRQTVGYRQERRPNTSAISPRKLAFAGGLGSDELDPQQRQTTLGEPTGPNDARRTLVPQQQQADANVTVWRQLISAPSSDILTASGTDPNVFHSLWFHPAKESAPVQGKTQKTLKPFPAQANQENQRLVASAHLPVAIGTPVPRAVPGGGGGGGRVEERRIPVQVEDDDGLVVAVVAPALGEDGDLRRGNADGDGKAIVGEEATR